MRHKINGVIPIDPTFKALLKYDKWLGSNIECEIVGFSSYIENAYCISIINTYCSNRQEYRAVGFDSVIVLPKE